MVKLTAAIIVVLAEVLTSSTICHGGIVKRHTDHTVPHELLLYQLFSDISCYQHRLLELLSGHPQASNDFRVLMIALGWSETDVDNFLNLDFSTVVAALLEQAEEAVDHSIDDESCSCDSSSESSESESESSSKSSESESESSSESNSDSGSDSGSNSSSESRRDSSSESSSDSSSEASGKMWSSWSTG